MNINDTKFIIFWNIKSLNLVLEKYVSYVNNIHVIGLTTLNIVINRYKNRSHFLNMYNMDGKDIQSNLH